jgi:hypothetical protein
MGWTLIVSEDDTFQREAIARAGERSIVGATGDSSARSLVRAVNVEQILVDARDDVGRRFLATMRSLPHASLPGIDVVAVGRIDPRIRSAATLADAMATSTSTTVTNAA